MSNEIISISYDRIRAAAQILASRHFGGRYTGVYGVPTGGSVIAPFVAGALGLPALPVLEDGCLVVDDLADSGRTLAKFSADGFRVDSLFRKPHTPPECAPEAIQLDGWLRFPWEKGAGPEDAVVRLLEWIGEDPTREGLRETPARVTKALRELTGGRVVDVPALLGKVFTSDCDEMVAVRNISFSSVCEHHLLPFLGHATVAYIPNGRVVGLSKLARLVEAHAQRLQLQEQLTFDIASDLMKHLAPLGAAALVRARHLCMGCRGVRKPEAEMVTSATLGLFRDDPKARAEFFELARA